jgi:hypothetical protein
VAAGAAQGHRAQAPLQLLKRGFASLTRIGGAPDRTSDRSGSSSITEARREASGASSAGENSAAPATLQAASLHLPSAAPAPPRAALGSVAERGAVSVIALPTLSDSAAVKQRLTESTKDYAPAASKRGVAVDDEVDDDTEAPVIGGRALDEEMLDSPPQLD